MTNPERCDLLVVGGGIHGAGIARDAAGRGLEVVLVEQYDLAAATSMSSSKLIHGGLRYLEQGRLRLVREALAEREILLRIAPHLVRPLSFLMPVGPGSRPAWQLRAGLWLYDHVAGRSSLPRSWSVDLAGHEAGAGLRPEYRRGFVYSDAWGDDARLRCQRPRRCGSRCGRPVPDARRSAGWTRLGGGLQREDGGRETCRRAVVARPAGSATSSATPPGRIAVASG
jgi:glycerol-3-phosphate dehydrogenase